MFPYELLVQFHSHWPPFYRVSWMMHRGFTLTKYRLLSVVLRAWGLTTLVRNVMNQHTDIVLTMYIYIHRLWKDQTNDLSITVRR